MTIPTIAEIRDDILVRIQTALDLSAPPLPRSVFGVIATSVAGALALVYRFAAWVRRQIFTQTMDAAQLNARGIEYGLVRTAPTRWIGTFTVTGNGTVPTGSLIDVEGNVYRTRTATVITATGSVEAESVETGAAVQLETAQEGEFVSPIAGITRTVLVATTTQNAVDAESDAAYRARILFRQQNQPQGGAFADWILWTTEVPGIAEAYVERPEAGIVHVYPLTDDPNPANRIPDGTKIAEVLAYISSDVRSPIRAAAIGVFAFSELNFDVDISDLSPNNATLRDAIESAIEAYMYSRRPRQYTDDPDPQDKISAGQITRIAIEQGAQVATVVLKNAGGTPITSYELDGGELALLRTLTWV